MQCKHLVFLWLVLILREYGYFFNWWIGQGCLPVILNSGLAKYSMEIGLRGKKAEKRVCLSERADGFSQTFPENSLSI